MTFFTALLLGLIASGHCAAMCSGLQNALQPNHIIRSKQRLFEHNIALNLGRLCCYTIVGALLAWSSIEILHLVGAGDYISWLRMLTAAILFFIGIKIILQHLGFQTGLEPMGELLWSKLKRLHKNNNKDHLNQSFTNGLVWGMLPCGLLYSLYFTAALSGNATQGGMIMLGFGLGTMPTMILSGTAWITFKRWFQHRQIRIAGGLFYCAGALMMAFSPFFISTSFAESYPGLVNMVFCLR